MNAPRLDMTRSGVGDLIQANLKSYMRLFAGLPGVAMRDDEVFWLVSGLPAPGNTILQARWTAETAEAGIDRLLDEMGQRLGEIDWMTFPGDQPADLRERLAARGMPSGPGGNWLWADLSALPLAPVEPAGFRVEQVRSDAALRVWVALSEAGFEAPLACYFDAYARHGYGPKAQSLHYLGYVDDTPVTSATLLDAGGTASLYDISTPPALRRQGYGAAMTRALMQTIRARGYAGTWIWSSNLGRGVYQSVGYVDADFGVREFRWKKPT